MSRVPPWTSVSYAEDGDTYPLLVREDIITTMDEEDDQERAKCSALSMILYLTRLSGFGFIKLNCRGQMPLQFLVAICHKFLKSQRVFLPPADITVFYVQMPQLVKINSWVIFLETIINRGGLRP